MGVACSAHPRLVGVGTMCSLYLGLARVTTTGAGSSMQVEGGGRRRPKLAQHGSQCRVLRVACGSTQDRGPAPGVLDVVLRARSDLQALPLSLLLYCIYPQSALMSRAVVHCEIEMKGLILRYYISVDLETCLMGFSKYIGT